MSRLVCIAGLLAILSACTSTSMPDSPRDCAHCPEMVMVPAGTAIVGASETDPFGRPDEKPQRTIEIREAFEVSRYEITRDQYEAFVHATGHAVGGDCLTDRVQRGKWELDARTTFRDPGFTQSGNHPVACVSWDDTQAYVSWLNTQTSGGYRLLTEGEWEYVSRAGVQRNDLYPWGSDPAAGCPFANGFDQTAMATYKDIDTSGYKVFDPLKCQDDWLNTSPVGSLRPNAFGVHDMIGNVAEWVDGCNDGPCTRRIAKGGSWGTLAHNLRIAERFPYAATHRDDSIGIRVAKTLRSK